MNLCTAIEKTKKGRFSVFVDGEFVCALHADVFSRSSIAVGRELEPDYLEELRLESEERITKDRALRLLSARSYTRRGLVEKLRLYSDAETAEAVAGRMEELGLIDDADYARRYAEECVSRKGFSLYRARQALLEKGIDRDVAEEALAEYEEEPEAAIATIIERK
jgi:regulatory protein